MMKILMPIFPESPAACETLWEQFHQCPVCTVLGTTLARTEKVALYIATDEPRVARLWEHEQYAHCALIKPEGEADLLPRGSAATVRHALACGFIRENETIGIVDYRNILLTPSALRNAYALHAEMQAPILSITAAEEHPVLLRQHYRIIAPDCVATIDPEAESPLPEHLLTHPFFLDWSYYAVTHGQGVYRRIPAAPDNPRPAMRHIRDVKTIAGAAGEYFVYENQQTARRIVPETDIRHGNSWLAGFSSLDALDTASILCTAHRDPGRTTLWIRQDLVRPEMEIRCYPLHGTLLSVPDIVEHTPGQSVRETLTFQGAIFHKGLELETAYHSLGVLLLDKSLDCSMDFSEPLDLQNAFWHFDPETLVPKDRQTGEVLTGRQQYPSVHSPDRSLTIAAAADTIRLTELFHNGRVHGFPLNFPDSGKALSVAHVSQLAVQLSQRRGHSHSTERP